MPLQPGPRTLATKLPENQHCYAHIIDSRVNHLNKQGETLGPLESVPWNIGFQITVEERDGVLAIHAHTFSISYADPTAGIPVTEKS